MEVRLDGPLAEEQRRGDLAVRTPLGDEGRHPTLGRGQPRLADATADPPQLGARLAGPPGGADRLEALHCRLDRLAGHALLASAPPEGAERKQRAGAAERVADGLVPR